MLLEARKLKRHIWLAFRRMHQLCTCQLKNNASIFDGRSQFIHHGWLIVLGGATNIAYYWIEMVKCSEDSVLVTRRHCIKMLCFLCCLLIIVVVLLLTCVVL